MARSLLLRVFQVILSLTFLPVNSKNWAGFDSRPVWEYNHALMSTFWALTRISIQRQFTYRAATFAGLATNAFFGLLRAAMMVALYAGQGSVSGMTIQDAITYTGLTQAMIAFLSLFSWFEIINSVQSGQVGADLLKPVSYFRFWMAQDLGRSLVSLLLRGLTLMVFYALVFDITVPQLPGQWLALVIALGLAWLVSYTWRFLINLAAFWTPDAVGVARFFFALSWVMSGFFMPLNFYPQWFVRLCYLTPFPSMVSTVVNIYLGLLDGPAMVQALFVQALWALGLAVLSSLVLAAGVRRLVIQGG
jgi:ABC-2 type transport system permease protein